MVHPAAKNKYHTVHSDVHNTPMYCLRLKRKNTHICLCFGIKNDFNIYTKLLCEQLFT